MSCEIESLCNLVQNTELYCSDENWKELLKNNEFIDHFLESEVSIESFQFAEKLKNTFLYYLQHITIFDEEHKDIELNLKQAANYNNQFRETEKLIEFLKISKYITNRIIETII